jgi:hypothetical protein
MSFRNLQECFGIQKSINSFTKSGVGSSASNAISVAEENTFGKTEVIQAGKRRTLAQLGKECERLPSHFVWTRMLLHGLAPCPGSRPGRQDTKIH